MMICSAEPPSKQTGRPALPKPRSTLLRPEGWQAKPLRAKQGQAAGRSAASHDCPQCYLSLDGTGQKQRRSSTSLPLNPIANRRYSVLVNADQIAEIFATFGSCGHLSRNPNVAGTFEQLRGANDIEESGRPLAMTVALIPVQRSVCRAEQILAIALVRNLHMGNDAATRR